MECSISNLRVYLWCCCLPAMLFAAQPALHAQGPPTFEAQVDATIVMTGNRFEVGFVLKNGKGNIVPPDFKGFKVLGRNQMSGYGFLNGQSYSHYTWYYELEALQPGTYTIGAASVQVQGKTLQTQPLTITVKARTGGYAGGGGQLNELPPGADDEVFIAGEFDQKTAYTGEQVIFRVNLYTRRTVINYDLLETPDFHGFYNKELQRFDPKEQFRNVGGKKYKVRTLLAYSLYAREAGKLSVDPVKIKLGVDNGSGLLGSILGASYIIVQTQPADIEVKDLPQPQPEHFSGGVGKYVWRVEPDRDSMSTDDALTVRVVLEGTGDENRFAPPKLTLPAGLEAYEPRVAESESFEKGGEEWVHAQTLEYIVLPRTPGNYSFTPELTVFDPDSNRYVTLKAEKSVDITVSQGKQFNTPGPVPTDSTEKPGFSWRNWLFNPLFWVGALVLPILLFLALYWLLRKKEKPRPQAPVAEAPPAQSGIKAAREGLARSRQYMQQGQVRAFYDALYHTLQTYFTAKLHIDTADLNQHSLRARLDERQAPEIHTGALLSAWQQCEQALFAGLAGEDNMERLLYQVETAINGWEKTKSGAAAPPPGT